MGDKGAGQAQANLNEGKRESTLAARFEGSIRWKAPWFGSALVLNQRERRRAWRDGGPAVT